MQLFNERSTRYAIADFYAGIVSSTFDMNVRTELQECMVRDDGLVELWDQAISHLSNGHLDKWQASFKSAVERSSSDLKTCGKNGKLHLVGRQLDNWWELFWNQEGVAEATFEKNRAANKGALLKEGVSMRLNWETGFSFDAGKRLGNLWKILIGEPVWSSDFDEWYEAYHEYMSSSEENSAAPNAERYPLADFYAGFFEDVWGEAYYEQIQECLIRDDMHFDAMG